MGWAERVESTVDPEAGARERLVTAALDALRAFDVTTVLEAIGVRELARRAGVGPQSIYHAFGSLDGLADAVLAHVYDPGPPHPTAFVPTERPTMAGTTEETLHFAYQRQRATLQGLIDDPDFPLRVGLWAFGGERGEAAYATYLRTLEARLANVPHLIFGQSEREPRPPFTHADIVAAYGALLHGTAIRQIVDPEPGRPDQFARAAIALTTTAQRPPGDRDDMYSRLSAMNHYPLDRRRAIAPHHTAIEDRLRDAARILLSEHGYDDTSRAQLLAQAGLPDNVWQTLHLTKHQLAVSVVRTDLAAVVRRPLDLSAVAHFLLERRHYLRPYVRDLISDVTRREPDPLLDALTTPELSPTQAALFLTVLIRRLLRTEDVDAAVAAALAAVPLPADLVAS